MADVCPSQGDNWLYPSPLTLNVIFAVRKFVFVLSGIENKLFTEEEDNVGGFFRMWTEDFGRTFEAIVKAIVLEYWN